ncbi:hypothetical protein QE152_g12831 [Popillia japonica]|uniref:DUF4219 domain-containing protein n=1 Tax=Popillia japonica TaxID=7064 RepID=A0AAW1LEV1_POPJA
MATNMLPVIEKLTGRENYNDWAFAMQAYLECEDLWSCIKEDNPASSDEVTQKRDSKAKSKITMMIHSSNFVHIGSAKSAKEVWNKLHHVFQDSGLCRKVSLMRKEVWNKLHHVFQDSGLCRKAMQDGSTHYKARLVVKGCAQRKGLAKWYLKARLCKTDPLTIRPDL